jgi:hypothetical protein
MLWYRLGVGGTNVLSTPNSAGATAPYDPDPTDPDDEPITNCPDDG